MSQDFSKLKVYTLLAFGLTAFGFAPVLVKYATDHSAFLIAAIRTVSAVLILLPVYIYYRTSGNRQVEKITTDGKLVFLAGVCLGVHFILWIGSLYYTSVASASVLVTIHPIMLILAERMLFKVKFAYTVWAGVFVAFAGSVLLGYADYNIESDFANPLLGNLMAFSAAAVFVIYFLIGRKVRQDRSWLGYVFPVYGYSALTCLAVLFALEGFQHEINWVVLLVGIGLAVGPQIMGHGSLNYAVKYVSPTLLSTLILTEPLFATVLAWYIFGEWPATLSFIAIFITLAGVALTWKKKPGKKGELTSDKTD